MRRQFLLKYGSIRVKIALPNEKFARLLLCQFQGRLLSLIKDFARGIAPENRDLLLQLHVVCSTAERSDGSSLTGKRFFGCAESFPTAPIPRKAEVSEN